MENDFELDWGDYSTPSYEPPSYSSGASSGGSTSWQDYMPGGSQYLPPGSGYFQVGNQAPQEIYTPPSYASTQYLDAGSYDAMRGAPPSPRTSGYGAGGYSGESLFGRGSTSPTPYIDPTIRRPSSSAPSSGARSVAQQTPQLISMGTPERTLYDRYKSLLTQPNQLESDPAYQFMYNQGLQALNRSLAARRMTMSGKAMNDTIAQGAGTAAAGMKQILPLYQAGAGEELNRFLGPAGLLPRYASSNNATIAGSNQMVNNADDRAMYESMLSGPESGPSADWGAGIGFGGQRSGYTSRPPTYAPPPRPMSYDSSSYGIPELMDEMY